MKGAYLEPEATAFPRNSPELAARYRELAKTLIGSGHVCSIATHDILLLDDLHNFIGEHGAAAGAFEFEMLLGLWDSQLDIMKSRGYPTREYVVYGSEWFLYVCNRVAEEPIRIYQALIDAVGTPA